MSRLLFEIISHLCDYLIVRLALKSFLHSIQQSIIIPLSFPLSLINLYRIKEHELVFYERIGAIGPGILPFLPRFYGVCPNNFTKIIIIIILNSTGVTDVLLDGSGVHQLSTAGRATL